MVKYNSDRIDKIFHALSDATRRNLLLQIAGKECQVTALAAPYKMSLAAVSKHLKVLETAGLLKRTVDGRIHRCKMNVEPLLEAAEVIKIYQAFWTDQLDALEKYLTEAGHGKAKKSRRRKKNEVV